MRERREGIGDKNKTEIFNHKKYINNFYETDMIALIYRYFSRRFGAKEGIRNLIEPMLNGMSLEN